MTRNRSLNPAGRCLSQLQKGTTWLTTSHGKRLVLAGAGLKTRNAFWVRVPLGSSCHGLWLLASLDSALFLSACSGLWQQSPAAFDVCNFSRAIFDHEGIARVLGMVPSDAAK
mmetsp:Transcript_10820/g.23927  ORF Transcript_10820/g.23927 Transcript_10820/m.23927 type:complete len:113 (-) Transcript_10820:89-427(-)